jgi:perosamine synthetase
MIDISYDIISRIKSVIRRDVAELHTPQINEIDYDYVRKCLDSGFVSSVGAFVGNFENVISDYCQAKHAIAVSSGTTGLHSLLYANGLDQDAEIILPAISFIATANSVLYCGGTPHFVDVDQNTLNICPDKLELYLEKITTIHNGVTVNKETKKKIFGVLCVSVFGRPPELNKVRKVCDKYNIPLFEDAAAALGSTCNGYHAGHYSEAAVLSFNGNKIITAGGGGVIVTNNDALAQNLKHLTTTAKLNHPWHFHHDRLGFNYRMPNINAALACAQFTKLGKILSAKQKLLNNYVKAFSDCEYGEILTDHKYIKSNNWLITLKLKETVLGSTEELLRDLNNSGLKCRPVWCPLPDQSALNKYPKSDLSNLERIWKLFISLPSSEYTIND